MALVETADTALNVVERGDAHGPPLLLLHGGPGLDHHCFGDYLDPLGDTYRLLFVDGRAQGLSQPEPPETWTLSRNAQDVTELAQALELERYAVLGHSYGSFVALTHAVEQPGAAAATIVSHGIPSERFLDHVQPSIDALEPEGVRERVKASWAAEENVRTPEEMRALLVDRLPLHFADPLDPRIDDFVRRTTTDAVYSPDVLRWAATGAYGHIELEDRLGEVTQPVLVIASRYDRVCSVHASVVMADALPHATFHELMESGHFGFAEQTEEYVATVRGFLDQHYGLI